MLIDYIHNRFIKQEYNNIIKWTKFILFTNIYSLYPYNKLINKGNLDLIVTFVGKIWTFLGRLSDVYGK